jgi:PAS domain S-box-containing protein
MQVLDSHAHQYLRPSVQSSSLEAQVMESIFQILQSHHPDEILKTAAQALQALLKVDRLVIYQIDGAESGTIVAESVTPGWRAALGMTIPDLRDLQSGTNPARDFKETQAVNDVLATSFIARYQSVLDQQQVKSSLVVPLVLEGMNWGAIVAHHCADFHAWEPAEIERCEQVTQHVAVILQRAFQSQQQQQQIHELMISAQALQDKNYQLKTLVSQKNFSALQANAQLKNKIVELESLNDSLALETAKSEILGDFALKIRQSLDSKAILDTATSEIQSCLHADRIVVGRIDASDIVTVIAESVLEPWPSALGIEFSGELFSAQCQQKLSAVPYKAVPDVVMAYGNSTPQLLMALEAWSIKSMVIVPILHGEKCWGFIIAHQCDATRHWIPAELNLLTQVATHVSISIEQAELHQKRQQELEILSRTEELLLVQHEQFSHVLNSSPGILYSCLVKGHYQRIFFGSNLFNLLGYSPLDAIETDFWASRIHPEDRPLVQVLSDRPSIRQEYRFLHKDGTYHWLYDQQKVVYDDHGQPIEWIGYCVDIDDRKQIEEQLKTSLSEKEILLQEIHHRVKNNLNIIISLLNLQSSYISDRDILAMFLDSQSRIRTMALIHEQLYRSETLARIDFADYITSLVNHLTEAYQPALNNIELRVSVMPVTLNLETATPCGLMINELLTNAFKHAFPDGRSGTISVILTREAERLQLVVQDNGIGLRSNLDWQTCSTLGLRLMRLLALQLEADLSQDSTEVGTCFRLTFSELAYDARL